MFYHSNILKRKSCFKKIQLIFGTENWLENPKFAIFKDSFQNMSDKYEKPIWQVIIWEQSCTWGCMRDLKFKSLRDYWILYNRKCFLIILPWHALHRGAKWPNIVRWVYIKVPESTVSREETDFPVKIVNLCTKIPNFKAKYLKFSPKIAGIL